MNIVRETLKVPVDIAMHSLVGIHGRAFPLSFGNYFALEGTTPGSILRVANFWAENLVEASRQFLEDGMVRIVMWSWTEMDRGSSKTYNASICVIDDERIPPDWYYNQMCFTGGKRPPLEVATEMYAIRGDETYELERFIDPEMYYAKRGEVYSDVMISRSTGDTAELVIRDLLTARELGLTLVEYRKQSRKGS